MRIFSFLLRVAFIFNLLFLCCFVLQFFPHLPDSGWISFILVAGWLMPLFLNGILCVWWLLAIRTVTADWPGFRFLLGANFFLFIFQLFYFFF
jgi:hypothetical protein